MSIAVSAIQSLIGEYPMSLFSAHPWYVDHPTDSLTIFDGVGVFTGGDLPFGLAYEVHNLPTTQGWDWGLSISFPNPQGHLVCNGALATGIGSDLPVEEFFFTRPRGLFLFREPATSSIDLEMVGSVGVKLWGLYIDIPLITPTQMGFAVTSSATTPAPPTFDGAVTTGVTGTGTLTVAPGVIGLRVEVTVLPPALGLEVGTPNVNFDIGWINWSDGLASRSREWITTEFWASFPNRPEALNQFSYSLTPGVEVTFIEVFQTRGQYRA